MMFLAVDIGNTNTKFGLFKQDEPFEMVFHFPTPAIMSGEHTEDELLRKLAALGDLDSVIIASVVPNATDSVSALLKRTHRESKIAIMSNADIPMVNRYQEPSEAGIDRLLSSFAAYSRWGKQLQLPVIVISFGTATTIDCVSSAGEYLGGIITLGVSATAKYLSMITAQLPEIELSFPEYILGVTTLESMRSGILFGSVAMTEGLIGRLKAEVFHNSPVLVIATGGLAALFEHRSKIIDQIEPNLVLEGIAISTFIRS